MAARVIHFRTGKDLERPALAPESGTIPPAQPVPARRKRGTEAAEQRKALLAKVHIAKTQLGMTEEEYRALLDGHFGAASAADLGLTDLKRLVLVMADYGFKPSKGHARRGATRISAVAIHNAAEPHNGYRKKTIPATLANDDANLGREALMRKIEAQLAEKGRAEGTDVPWGYAVAILKRQSGGVTRCFEHATPEQLRGVIAALTRDARRNGRRAY